MDATGITIRGLNDSLCVTFDATTTPILSVTGINQVTVDDAGNIWIACSNTGLHRLSDPLGSPTVSTMSNAANSIPAAGDTAAYVLPWLAMVACGPS